MRISVVLILVLFSGLRTLSQDRLPVRDKITVRKIPANASLDFVKEVDIVFMPVMGGTFPMRYWKTGTPTGSEYTNQVTLSSYYMSRYEITELQWKVVMGDDYRVTECDSCPITRVTWLEATEYAKKLSAMTGNKYRLPTNAEWEYACYGGMLSKGKKYAGSDNIGDVAWYSKNSGSKVHPVGTKMPNELGLYDMIGNVSEWCADWSVMLREGEYEEHSTTNPKGPATGRNKIYRGDAFIGYWGDDQDSRFARHEAPDNGNRALGFRLVRDLDK